MRSKPGPPMTLQNMRRGHGDVRGLQPPSRRERRRHARDRDGPAAAQNLRRALLTRSTGQRRRPMKRRDISITTGVAVLAMQAHFDIEMAAINLILDRIDDRISKLEAKP
jgi:hypothetical protein